MKRIPNLFTLLNLLFGCFAIVVTLQNGITIQYSNEGTQYLDIPEKIWMSSLLIGLAAVVDFLDGLVARFLHATSELGKQLDSLSDVVSFGVAPSMILYQFLRISVAKHEDALDTSVVWLIPAFFIAGAAACRLAKFNLDTRQQNSFIGVPTPAVGLLVASFPLIYWYAESLPLIELLTNQWVLYLLILLLCFLMLSNLPLLALKFNGTSAREKTPFIILLAIAIVAAIFLRWVAVPIIFISYIILSLIFKKQKG